MTERKVLEVCYKIKCKDRLEPISTPPPHGVEYTMGFYYTVLYLCYYAGLEGTAR